MRASSSCLLAAVLTLLLCTVVRAEGRPRSSPDSDHFELSAHSETYTELFRRALLPGPNGSLVSSDVAAPLYQFGSLQVRDLDAPWRKDSVDLELAIWGRAWFDNRNAEQVFDGDVQIASVRYRGGPFSLRLGRQQVAGGAARFVRFDGAELEGDLASGVDLSVYGGWTVLPRWNERLQYEHLGASADTLLRAPALDSNQRADYWLSGGRVGWSAGEQRAGVSFHEQHEPGGLARRNLGLDGRSPLAQHASLGGSALFDLERARFADARLWLDTQPARSIDLSLAYLHTEPALFLSSQSVLSVFGSAGFEEAGGYAAWRANDALTFDGAAFADVYDGERPGARAELGARYFADAARRTFARITYARLLASDNGYHSLRSSLSRLFSAHFRGTVEAYAYLYDKAIFNYRASTVYAGTLSYEPSAQVSLVLGASLAHSPYASLDAQTQLRVSYSFESGRGR
jgi:hypothetical protein